MKVEKKYIIAGILGAISIAAGALYLQYKKIMDYVIKFKKVKVKKLSANLIDFDLTLLFLNKSDIKFTINSQSYSVYINNAFVTKLVNYADVNIQPKKESELSLNVKFNPRDVLKVININLMDFVANQEKVKIKMDIKLRVSLYGIPINIPYVYESTLKEMTAPAPGSVENK